MTRNEEVAAQMRAEFAANRAEFLAEASPFELKLDAALAAAERVIAKAMVLIIGPEPVMAAATEDALSN